MEALESLLRDEYGRPIDLDDLAPGEVIARTYRIRRRRVAGRAAGGVTAAAVAAVILITSFTGVPHSQAPTRPAPVPTAVDASRVADAIRQLRADGSSPTGFAYSDPSHGFGLFTRCTHGVSYDKCDKILGVTSDGGATFTPIATPGLGQPVEPMYAFDADRAVIEPISATLDGNAAGWLTTDAGRTWQAVSRDPMDAADRIPDDTRLTDVGLGERDVLVAIGPTGHLTRITSAPPDSAPLSHTAIDGVYLIRSGTDWFTSADQGRTWQRASLPIAVGSDDVQLIGAAHGTWYAWKWDGTVPGGQAPPQVLLASSDRGLTWHQVALPPVTPLVGPTEVPDGKGGSMTADRWTAVPTPAGLIVNDDARTWRLPPGRSGFVADDQRFPIVAVFNAGGAAAYALSVDLREAHPTPVVYVSTNGINWGPVTWP